MKNLLVGQSGGPTSVINASLAGVIKNALESSEIERQESTEEYEEITENVNPAEVSEDLMAQLKSQALEDPSTPEQAEEYLDNINEISENVEKEQDDKEKEEDEVFEYYKVILPPTKKKVSYYFRLQYGEEEGFYNKYGFFNEFKDEGRFEIIRDFVTPDWAKGAVMYQIYPDRFCNGDPSNDVQPNEYI